MNESVAYLSNIASLGFIIISYSMSIKNWSGVPYRDISIWNHDDNSCLIILASIFEFLSRSLLVFNCCSYRINHLYWDFKKIVEIMRNYSESRKSQSLISGSIFYCSFKVKYICFVVNRINEFAYTSSIWIPSTLTICCLQVFLNTIQINDKLDWISTVMYVGTILKNSSEPNHFH